MAADIKTLYEAGTHFGFSRARRHPSAAPYIYGTKDRTDIFDLEESVKRLDAARAFLTTLAESGKQLLIVGGKEEATVAVAQMAERIGAPFVAGRWIGGTLTNFKNIHKRIERLLKLTQERESGELGKYTKKERLLIDREIDVLIARFGGLVTLNELPGALLVIDSRHEDTAVKEANQLKIPVVALSNSDCDFALVQYPIPGNDTSIKSIKFITDALAQAYEQGKKAVAAKSAK